MRKEFPLSNHNITITADTGRYLFSEEILMQVIHVGTARNRRM